MKIYPVNPQVIPASGSISERLTAHVAPAGTVPSAAIPIPARFVELDVKLAAVPAPVAVFGNRSSLRVPVCSVAPPKAAPPNGSRVVFATAIPVSYVQHVANGTSNTVLAGTILTTVALPTWSSPYRGKSRPVMVLSSFNATPIGCIVADTVTLPGAILPLVGVVMLVIRNVTRSMAPVFKSPFQVTSVVLFAVVIDV